MNKLREREVKLPRVETEYFTSYSAMHAAKKWNVLLARMIHNKRKRCISLIYVSMNVLESSQDCAGRSSTGRQRQLGEERENYIKGYN